MGIKIILLLTIVQVVIIYGHKSKEHNQDIHAENQIPITKLNDENNQIFKNKDLPGDNDIPKEKPLQSDSLLPNELSLPEAKPIPAPYTNHVQETPRIIARNKRSLIIPGTNWCGTGNRSPDSYEVGDIAGPDRCCKQHDQCPHNIRGLTTKYGLYNHRFYTISHCECDDIFRTCLKVDSSENADIVGNIFFNYIGMKCFVFKQVEKCVERAWWGKCEQYGMVWQAETRDPLTYPN